MKPTIAQVNAVKEELLLDYGTSIEAAVIVLDDTGFWLQVRLKPGSGVDPRELPVSVGDVRVVCT